jgi:hypothetical protein
VHSRAQTVRCARCRAGASRGYFSADSIDPPPAEEKLESGSSQSSSGMESEPDFDALEMLPGGLPIFERGDDFSDGSVRR